MRCYCDVSPYPKPQGRPLFKCILNLKLSDPSPHTKHESLCTFCFSTPPQLWPDPHTPSARQEPDGEQLSDIGMRCGSSPDLKPTFAALRKRKNTRFLKKLGIRYEWRRKAETWGCGSEYNLSEERTTKTDLLKEVVLKKAICCCL